MAIHAFSDFDARSGHDHRTKFRMRQDCLPMLYENATVNVPSQPEQILNSACVRGQKNGRHCCPIADPSWTHSCQSPAVNSGWAHFMLSGLTENSERGSHIAAAQSAWTAAADPCQALARSRRGQHRTDGEGRVSIVEPPSPTVSIGATPVRRRDGWLPAAERREQPFRAIYRGVQHKAAVLNCPRSSYRVMKLKAHLYRY